MITAHVAKSLATQHLKTSGSSLVAFRAARDRHHDVWVVSYRDPVHVEEMLIGGALVVTDDGSVHDVGSAPDALDLLMESLGRGRQAPDHDIWAREGEGLTLLADHDMDEAEALVDWVAALRPWPEVLGPDLDRPAFRNAMAFAREQRKRHEVYPPEGDMFAAFHLTSFDRTRVVILGQDPYHQPGQAHGLCFSVPKGVKKPPSLRNIHAAMNLDQLHPPEHGDLTVWAGQGVLLLNTALTVRRGEANSHAKEWKAFTDTVIRRLSGRQGPVVFVLWGRAAQAKRPLIDETRHHVITAPHPAARGRSQTEFRQARTFHRINELLSEPIEWEIP